MALATSNLFTVQSVAPASGLLSVATFSNNDGTGYVPFNANAMLWQSSPRTTSGTLIEWAEAVHGPATDNSIREYDPDAKAISIKFPNDAGATNVSGFDNEPQFYIPSIDSFIMPAQNGQWSRASNSWVKGNVPPASNNGLKVIGTNAGDLIFLHSSVADPAWFNLISPGNQIYNAHMSWSSTYNCGFMFGGSASGGSDALPVMLLFVPTSGLGLGNPQQWTVYQHGGVPATVSGAQPYKDGGRNGCCFLGDYVYWAGGTNTSTGGSGAGTAHFFRMRITPHLTSMGASLTTGAGVIERLADAPYADNFMLLMADKYTNSLLLVSNGGIYAYDVTYGAWTSDLTPSAYRSWPGDGQNSMPRHCLGDFIDTSPLGVTMRKFVWRPGKGNWLSDSATGFNVYRSLKLQRSNYSNTFTTTENPLSDGGIWRGSDPNQTRVRTTGGFAVGTQSGADAFDDSMAYLPGFGNNYEVTCTLVKNAGASGGTNKEVEIWLRAIDGLPTRSTAFGNTQSNGYEINLQQDGAYLQCGRFKDINLVDMVPTVAPATGVVFRARIEGQRIRCWLNNVLQFDRTDSAPGNLTTGHPGIGFYRHASDASSLPTHFCFTDVLIAAL